MFVGVPVHRTEWQELPARPDSIPSIRFSFKVERTLKGPRLAHAIVDTDRTDCGVPFEFGRRYQVYAFSLPRHGIQWRTSQCTETKALEEKRPGRWTHWRRSMKTWDSTARRWPWKGRAYDMTTDLEASMKTNVRAALAAAVLAGLGLGAAANMPGPPPTPSAALGIEIDVKPVAGTHGQFVVSSVVTDLENDAVIAKPRLLIAAGKPARIETGNEGKWQLRISVTADGVSRKADYEANFTRAGKLVSRQRVTVNLDS